MSNAATYDGDPKVMRPDADKIVVKSGGKLIVQDLGLIVGPSEAQFSTTGNVTGFAAGSGTASKSDSVWAGSAGSTAYTVGDLVTILKSLGILAP